MTILYVIGLFGSLFLAFMFGAGWSLYDSALILIALGFGSVLMGILLNHFDIDLKFW